MEIEFNTNREYSADGQIILAAYRNGNVRFNDLTRGVAGRFAVESAPETETDLRVWVMIAYDEGRYENDPAEFFAPLRRVTDRSHP
jgi:hypothetical protein